MEQLPRRPGRGGLVGRIWPIDPALAGAVFTSISLESGMLMVAVYFKACIARVTRGLDEG